MTKLATQMGKSYLVSSSKISKSCPDDIEEADTACTSCAETPKYLQAIFSGSLADQDCYSCENIPTTYVAEQTSACQWKLNLCNCNTRTPITLVSDMTIEIVTSGSDYILRVTVDVIRRTALNPNAGQDTAVYEKNLGTTIPDCRAFASQALTFQSLVDGSVCGDWSALSVTVNAVNGPGDNDDRQCGYCMWQSEPDEFTVKVTGGLTDGNCDCSDLGPSASSGEVTVDKFNQSGDDCCDWRGTYVGDCTWSYHLTVLDGQIDVQVIGPTDTINYSNTGLSEPHNCQFSVSCAHVSQTSQTNCSGYSSSTAEVMAV